MGKRQPSPERLTPEAGRLMACVFRTPMGLDGYFRNDEGDQRCGVAEGVAPDRAGRIGIFISRAVGGQDFSTIARGAGAVDRLSGRNAQVLRSASGPLTRDKFSAEGLADPPRYLLRPASILSMGSASGRRKPVCQSCWQCRGGESDADRDSVPSNCGTGFVPGRILRRLDYETKTPHSRRNPG